MGVVRLQARGAGGVALPADTMMLGMHVGSAELERGRHCHARSCRLCTPQLNTRTQTALYEVSTLLTIQSTIDLDL